MKIRINDMNFEYRTDILFRMYVLKTNDLNAWQSFCALKSNRKVKVNSLYKMYSSIKKHGMKTPIKVVFFDGMWYPGDGATRISCMWTLGKIHIRSKEVLLPTNIKWNDYKGLNSHHFHLGQELIDRFVMFLYDMKDKLPKYEKLPEEKK